MVLFYFKKRENHNIIIEIIKKGETMLSLSNVKSGELCEVKWILLKNDYLKQFFVH